jgi:hypothetical protein
MMFIMYLTAPLLALVMAASLLGCGGYVDTLSPAGIPNLHQFAPSMWRTGLPPTQAAWNELRATVEEPGKKVTRVILHDHTEGDESQAAAFGWNLVWVPLPPEDDHPFSVLVRPRKKDVDLAVKSILDAHARGDVVVFGCVHGRDRTGVVAALAGEQLLGWSKQQAWAYALDTGLRWELPGLDAYWVEDAP